MPPNNRRNNRIGSFTQGGEAPTPRTRRNISEEIPLGNGLEAQITPAPISDDWSLEDSDFEDFSVDLPTTTPVEERNLTDIIQEHANDLGIRAAEALRELRNRPNRLTFIEPPTFYTGRTRSMDLREEDPYTKLHERPNLDPNTKVETKDGSKHLVSDCVWYNGKWYHNKNENIVKDCISGELIHLSQATDVITECIFPNTEKGKCKFKSEYTKNSNRDKCIPIWSKKFNVDTLITSLDGLKNWKYKESLEHGCYVDEDQPECEISSIKRYDQFKNPFRNVTDKKVLTEIGQISPSYSITEGLRYSFGIELEMSRGFLPVWKAANGYNVSCVRDGSLNTEEGGNGGPEIVTGVLTGDTGINHLQKICLELSKRTKVNQSCGMHIHLGGINFSKKFLVNSYILALLLEDEIASTLPLSRRENQYCRKLKTFNFRPSIGNDTEDIMKLEEDYNRLFRHISVEKTNNPNFDYNKSKQHPLGPKCGYQHGTPRYCWLNYVPAMFNTRNNGSYSLELRNHSGTTNFNKVRNWLLLFMAFCAFVERHPELIVKGITINDILEKIFPKKAKSLIIYFNSRKELFNEKENDSEYQEKVIDKKTIKELINN